MKPTITDIISRISQDKVALGVKLFNGASEEQITAFEHAAGIALAQDFKIFYRFSNGFDHDEDMFRMLPLDEILENLTDARASDYLVWQQDFHFAEYMIYCDMWTVSINNAQHNNYTIYNRGARTIMLTTDLAEFLERLLNGGVSDGLYSWMEELNE